MTILFVGSEQEAFELVGASDITFSTTPGYFQSAYSRGAIKISSTAWCQASFDPQTDIWVHDCFSNFSGSSDSTNNIVEIVDSDTGSSRVVVYDSGSGGSHTILIGYWNGSSFTYIDSGFNPGAGSAYDIDIHAKISAFGGAVELYIDGVQLCSFSGNTSGVATSFDKIKLKGTSGSGSAVGHSQVVVSTSMTIGMKVATLSISGEGNISQWTGAYTDINETTLSDVNFISDNVNSDISTYPVTDVPVGGNFNVGAIVVSARAERGATGVQNLELGVRSGGANHWGSPVSGLITAFSPVQEIMTTDPATGLPWTIAGANAIEIGVQALT